jgi:hypothetical protein
MAKSKAITRVSLKEAHPIRRRNKQVEEAAAAGANCVEHEEKASGLTIHRAGHKQLATLRTLDTLEIYTPYLGRRNHAATFWTDGIERCLHFFEIDLPRAWHGPGRDFTDVLPAPRSAASLHSQVVDHM